MNKSNVWIETVTIPTYPVDTPQKAPVFLEKRVYQGSSGRVYPYPVTEAISDEKTDRQYQAVFLENEYPENLGEGKLEGTKDNHLYYHLGLALEGQGRADEARECFELATLGTDEPAGALYYNDQPADMILYQGLSYLKLGDMPKARSRFYRLLDYGERHLNDVFK